jgi:hypothetical protein
MMIIHFSCSDGGRLTKRRVWELPLVVGARIGRGMGMVRAKGKKARDRE